MSKKRRKSTKTRGNNTKAFRPQNAANFDNIDFRPSNSSLFIQTKYDDRIQLIDNGNVPAIFQQNVLNILNALKNEISKGKMLTFCITITPNQTTYRVSVSGFGKKEDTERIQKKVLKKLAVFIPFSDENSLNILPSSQVQSEENKEGFPDTRKFSLFQRFLATATTKITTDIAYVENEYNMSLSEERRIALNHLNNLFKDENFKTLLRKFNEEKVDKNLSSMSAAEFVVSFLFQYKDFDYIQGYKKAGFIFKICRFPETMSEEELQKMRAKSLTCSSDEEDDFTPFEVNAPFFEAYYPDESEELSTLAEKHNVTYTSLKSLYELFESKHILGVAGQIAHCAEDALLKYMIENTHEFNSLDSHTFIFSTKIQKQNVDSVLIEPRCSVCAIHFNHDICSILAIPESTVYIHGSIPVRLELPSSAVDIFPTPSSPEKLTVNDFNNLQCHTTSENNDQIEQIVINSTIQQQKRAAQRFQDFCISLEQYEKINKHQKRADFLQSTEFKFKHISTISDGNCALNAVALGLLHHLQNGIDLFIKHKKCREIFANIFDIDQSILSSENFSRLIESILSYNINLSNPIVCNIIKKLENIPTVTEGNDKNQLKQRILCLSNKVINASAYENGQIKEEYKELAIRKLAQYGEIFQLVMSMVLRDYCVREKMKNRTVNVPDGRGNTTQETIIANEQFGQYLGTIELSFLAEVFNIKIREKQGENGPWLEHNPNGQQEIVLFALHSTRGDCHYELGLPLDEAKKFLGGLLLMDAKTTPLSNFFKINLRRAFSQKEGLDVSIKPSSKC